MYYPILRGRQFDLIAIRELVEKGILNECVIPVVEPIKPTSTLLNTLKTFVKKKRQLIFIMNPQVGRLRKELKTIKDETLKNNLKEIIEDQYITPMYILSAENKSTLKQAILYENIQVRNTCVLIEKGISKNDVLKIFEHEQPKIYFVPDKIEFRRGFPGDKVIVADHFPAKERNADYLHVGSQLFSTHHLYYKEENYIGFSDYSTIGKAFMESGFAPYAVVIHIVYFDENNELRIRHFTSETNDSYFNPAQKFFEALKKLVKWKNNFEINSYALEIFNSHYKNGTYPGLGVVKQLSIMHHLQIMAEFLQEEK